MKKTLAVIFYANNTNEVFNTNKDIINANNYPNKRNLIQNKNPIDWKDSNVELLNLDTAKFLKDLLANAYKKTN